MTQLVLTHRVLTIIGRLLPSSHEYYEHFTTYFNLLYKRLYTAFSVKSEQSLFCAVCFYLLAYAKESYKSVASVAFAQFSEFSIHQSQCLDGDSWKNTNQISMLIRSSLTHFKQRLQKFKFLLWHEKFELWHGHFKDFYSNKQWLKRIMQTLKWACSQKPPDKK